jgi:hypothetical protein
MPDFWCILFGKWLGIKLDVITPDFWCTGKSIEKQFGVIITLDFIDWKVIWNQIGCNYLGFLMYFVGKVIGNQMKCNYNQFFMYFVWNFDFYINHEQCIPFFSFKILHYILMHCLIVSCLIKLWNSW